MPVKSKSKASQIKRRLIAILGGSPCYKLIDYQASIWKVSLSADATDVVTADLKEITKQSQEITLATNHAKLLDDYQFFLCKDIERWADDKEYIEKLRGHRIMAAAYIVRLAEILEQIRIDSNNEGLKQELVRISIKMSRLIDKLEKSVLGG
jgi:hypothetical protein